MLIKFIIYLLYLYRKIWLKFYEINDENTPISTQSSYASYML